MPFSFKKKNKILNLVETIFLSITYFTVVVVAYILYV